MEGGSFQEEGDEDYGIVERRRLSKDVVLLEFSFSLILSEFWSTNRVIGLVYFEVRCWFIFFCVGIVYRLLEMEVGVRLFLLGLE